MRIILPLLVLGAAILADEVDTKLSPKAAWQKFENDRRSAQQNRDRAAWDNAAKEAKEFLPKWEVSKAKATGEELFFLGNFLNLAERPADAMKAYLATANDESLPGVLRTRAKISFAGAAAAAIRKGDVKGEEAAGAVKTVDGFRTGIENKQQLATMHAALGSCQQALHQYDASIKSYLAAAAANPAAIPNYTRSIGSALLHEGLDIEKLPAVQKRGAEIKAELVAMYSAYAKGSSDQRTMRSLQRVQGIDKTVTMLGNAAPEWTLEHAYGDLKTLAQLKGKVVVIDFWATWCPWCIKSFPAIRDLLKDYQGKPLVVVGATATSGYVWEARYDLDDDFKDKAPPPGTKVPPTLQLPRGADEAAVKEHRAKEKDVIATFIKNHQMTWPVVMIDKAEPSAKYALAGWPHAVVIDKQGRIRYFKSGALLRDRPQQVKDFRKILDKLLAEK